MCFKNNFPFISTFIQFLPRETFSLLYYEIPRIIPLISKKVTQPKSLPTINLLASSPTVSMAISLNSPFPTLLKLSLVLLLI